MFTLHRPEILGINSLEEVKSPSTIPFAKDAKEGWDIRVLALHAKSSGPNTYVPANRC